MKRFSIRQPRSLFSCRATRGQHQHPELWAAHGGQSAVEMLLIMTMFFGLTVVIAENFKSNDNFKNLVSGPWEQLAGMIQNGVWGPADESSELHPNQLNRHRQLQGEAP